MLTPRIARSLLSPHISCMLVEVVFLFVVGWLPATFPDAVLVLGVAFAASIQLATFSQVRGAAYASTFTSGNLRKLAESLLDLTIDRNNNRTRILASAFAALCTAFFIGACVGSICTLRLANQAAWVVDAWLGLVTWRLVLAHRRSRMLVSTA